MRVQLVDPAAYTPPYDHALASALAGAGAEVEVVPSHFSYGPVPRGEGYEVREHFYRRSSRAGLGPRRRRILRAAEHVLTCSVIARWPSGQTSFTTNGCPCRRSTVACWPRSGLASTRCTGAFPRLGRASPGRSRRCSPRWTPSSFTASTERAGFRATSGCRPTASA